MNHKLTTNENKVTGLFPARPCIAPAQGLKAPRPIVGVVRREAVLAPVRRMTPTPTGVPTPFAKTRNSAPHGVGLDSQAARRRMVEHLKHTGVHNPNVLRAFMQVPRHRFVATAFAKQSYEDTSLPIGHEQTISKPSVIAWMMQLLDESPLVRQGRVLDIGTGCGYQAVLLSLLAQEVYSIERIAALQKVARKNILGMGLVNLHLIAGDGFIGFAKGAPYAGIISAAAPDSVPAAWIEQLAIGGRLITPVQVGLARQVLIVVDKYASGIRQQQFDDVRFVSLKVGRE